MTIEQLYQLYLQHPTVQTDTRNLKEGEIFFALKGPNYNANEFAGEALTRGAACVVVDEQLFEPNDRIILVQDVLQTLQDLAKHHRMQLKIPVVGITGSNGKTTTKELVHTVLSAKFKCYTTRGNLNNHIGVPLTLLSIRQDAEIAVIEMGANHIGEIAGYCEYAQPDYGIITNCGKAHLEGFGSLEGVRKGKGELYDYLRAHNGTAFVMWDYDYLREMSAGIPKVITYGTADAEVTGSIVEDKQFLSVRFTKGFSLPVIDSQLVGGYNLPNVLVTVTVGKFFGVPDADIKTAIEQYAPSNSRSQLLSRNGATIVLDAYNANPSSMRAAISNFAAMAGDKKILMLGAMAELGEESLQEHQEILDLLARFNWSAVVLVGGDFQRLDTSYFVFPDSLAAGKWLAEQSIAGSSLLIKGSRSMKMEQVLAALPV